jgi:hypothetical protein
MCSSDLGYIRAPLPPRTSGRFSPVQPVLAADRRGRVSRPVKNQKRLDLAEVRCDTAPTAKRERTMPPWRDTMTG